jgi:hypothetical protein
LVLAVGSLAWAIGVVTDVFATPAFSPFWWLSHYDANLAAFFGLSLFGSALSFTAVAVFADRYS